MSRESTCRCLICNLERSLWREAPRLDFADHCRAFSGSDSLVGTFPSASAVVDFLHTRSSENLSVSDRILAELLQTAVADSSSDSVRGLLLLIFIPLLHHTARQVAIHYPALSPDDIAQQVIASLLGILGSAEFYRRSSHLAFSIARALKRQAFEWAAREARFAAGSQFDATIDSKFADETAEPLERTVLLRHFLHRCEARGLITGQDLELLVHFKLEAIPNRTNASRQRMKRLVGKLRRIAQKPPDVTQLRLF